MTPLTEAAEVLVEYARSMAGLETTKAPTDLTAQVNPVPTCLASPRHQHTCVDCGAQFIEDEPERYKGLCPTCAGWHFE